MRDRRGQACVRDACAVSVIPGNIRRTSTAAGSMADQPRRADWCLRPFLPLCNANLRAWKHSPVRCPRCRSAARIAALPPAPVVSRCRSVSPGGGWHVYGSPCRRSGTDCPGRGTRVDRAHLRCGCVRSAAFRSGLRVSNKVGEYPVSRSSFAIDTVSAR
jgi:hypothetical protein